MFRPIDAFPRAMFLAKSFIMASSLAATAAALTDASTQAPAGSGPEAAALDAAVSDTLKPLGMGIDASVWLGGTDGPARYERAASRTMPTASAVKTFYLVEFFADRKNSLDRPVPAADAVLADDAHPAISHFTDEQKDDIRRTLKGRSARQIGEIMMGKAPASNAAYNVAANLITAVLGGPEGLTKRIHARNPAFADVFVRRYMLRDRSIHGDNEAPARALAELYRNLATHSLAGIDRPTSEAIRAAIVRTEAPSGTVTYVKTGSLASDPLTRVEAGWRESPHGVFVFVVMLRQATAPLGQERSKASETLGSACETVRDLILDKAASSKVDGS